MKARLTISALAAALLLALLPGGAQAAFGFQEFDVTFTEADGSTVVRAGSHPFAMTTTFEVNTVPHPNPELGEVPDEPIKDFSFTQIEGLVGNPTAVPTCTTLQFLFREDGLNGGECPDSSAVGITHNQVISLSEPEFPAAVYNLDPPPGVAAKLGFWAANVPVTVEVGVSETYPYNIVGNGRNIPQPVAFYGSEFVLWGNPADPAHDDERGACATGGTTDCSANIPVEPFLTVPRACRGPLETRYEVRSWLNPDKPVFGSELTHDEAGNPQGFLFCEDLGFSPEIAAQPTAVAAESPTGLDFSLEFEDEGLVNPTGRAQSEIRKAVVTLPRGMTANPSLAEGLGVCSQAQYESERIDTAPGAGCPNSSKIGTIEVRTPLLEGKSLSGSLYVAEPFKNQFGSLIALYMVFRSTELGIVLKQAGRVTPDPLTGQLVSTFEDIPQLPFSDLELHFREGGRSPLINPPTCGAHTAVAQFTPWSDSDRTVTKSSTFQITAGPDGRPCPPGGAQPFQPGFSAGSLNNDAGSHTSFHMRLTRRDGDQDITRFSATLPPGVLGKLAGIGKCSNARIAQAKAKAGKDELRSPSCPAGSEIGDTLAGAGVGSQLTYVPGKLYLAGPFGGDPLSVVAITPAVAGPFDVGTVVVRQALTLDPVTGEVQADGASSDPIPHLLAGIPLKLRDLRVDVDRERFILNPTSCLPFQTRATLLGGGSVLAPSAIETPAFLTSRFQAANCANLGFKPRLALRLKGGTRRGAHPALRAVYRPRPGNANLRRMALRFPRSEFIENANFRTICTRVQWNADACPKDAIYGRVSAFTPLLDEPLRGPVYLRSSDNLLPDLVFDLRGIVDIEVALRIDSVKGRLRATLTNAPDAPVSRVVVRMQGGDKGLFVNSRNICAGKNRAAVRLAAQSGRRASLQPVLRPKCNKQKRRPR
jgi:hypothetical protein